MPSPGVLDGQHGIHHDGYGQLLPVRGRLLPEGEGLCYHSFEEVFYGCQLACLMLWLFEEHPLVQCSQVYFQGG